MIGEDGLDASARSGRTAACHAGTRPRPPRSPRCRPRARSRPVGRPPGPAPRRGTPRRRGGRTPRSARSVQSTAGAASGIRSGQVSPSAIGISMVGGLACTIVEPSTNSTIECTTLVGCTTTSIRSNGMPNSRCASITSRPLLTRVAELMVITGPMSQVGCASACSGVTSREVVAAPAAERAAASGEHEASYLLGGAGAQALRERAVLGVDGDDLARLRPVEHERAAHDQRLLVGQRERRPGLERGQRRAQPDRAGDAVEHDVAGRRGGLGRGLLAETGERRGELLDLAREQVRVAAARRSARRPGTGRGWRARCPAPGCRSSRSTRG